MPHCVIEGARSLLQTLGGDELVARVHAAAAVSYTHLTLPTIYSV